MHHSQFKQSPYLLRRFCVYEERICVKHKNSLSVNLTLVFWKHSCVLVFFKEFYELHSLANSPGIALWFPHPSFRQVWSGLASKFWQFLLEAEFTGNVQPGSFPTMKITWQDFDILIIWVQFSNNMSLIWVQTVRKKCFNHKRCHKHGCRVLSTCHFWFLQHYQ